MYFYICLSCKTLFVNKKNMLFHHSFIPYSIIAIFLLVPFYTGKVLQTEHSHKHERMKRPCFVLHDIVAEKAIRSF